MRLIHLILRVRHLIVDKDCTREIIAYRATAQVGIRVTQIDNFLFLDDFVEVQVVLKSRPKGRRRQQAVLRLLQLKLIPLSLLRLLSDPFVCHRKRGCLVGSRDRQLLSQWLFHRLIHVVA